MKTRYILFAIPVIALAALVRPAAAQTWDTPTFFAPGPHDEIGVYLIDPDGGDVGLMGIWRQSGRINLGIRAGFGGRSGDHTTIVGAEFSGPLVTAGGAQPFAVSWSTGVGAAFDGITWFRVPAGVSVGINIPGPSFTLTPYVHPRLALDIFSYSSDNRDDTDVELNADFDIGADLAVGAAWTFRLGITRGDSDVIGVGAAYRFQRGAEVR